MNPISDKPEVSVVIVTWNGKKYALECLESLRTAHPNLEVIVVDNASTDGTPEAIEAAYPEVKLIRNTENLGFAKANNAGIAVASADFVALVNSDVVVPPGCLQKMVQFLKAHSDVGLIGPKMMSPSGGVGQSVNQLPTVWNYFCFALGLHFVMPNSKAFGGYIMSAYPYNQTEDVEVLTGWFWLSPRAAVTQVGGLDERFFMYGEDLDWCYRFRKAGWRIVFFADSEALHYGAASSGQAPVRFYLEMVRANLQYFKKHYGWFGAASFVLSTGIHEVIRLVAYGMMYCLQRSKRQELSSRVNRSISCLRWLVRRPV
jgi:GT2 family glycosyltransferase